MPLDEVIDYYTGTNQAMTLIDNKPDINAMRDVGQLTRQLLDYITQFVVEGITTIELNDLCHNYTVEILKAESAPLNYKGFPKSICTSINDVACHGIPNNTKLKNGDIINIDVTLKKQYGGLYHFADSSRMFLIGDVKEEHKKLCDIAKYCLDQAIQVVSPGQKFSQIGEIVESIADQYGYSVARNFCGHGIGLEFHTDPMVLHFRNNYEEIMKPGMIFTIEPIINQGSWQSLILEDGWTCLTKDGKYSAQYEHTLLVTDSGHEILT